MYFLLRKSNLILYFACVLCFQSIAQNRNVALDLHEQAKMYYYQQDTKQAIIYAVKAISKDSTFAEPYILLANIYQDKNDFEAAMLAYRKGLELDPAKFSKAFLTLAEIELNADLFSLAIDHANQFLARDELSKMDKQKAQLLIASAEFCQKALLHPLSFQKNKLKYLSNGSDEYINGISLDGKKILFTQKKKLRTDSEGRSFYSEQIFEAELFGDSLGSMKLFELPPEMMNRVGAASLSIDGRYLFFTSCHQAQSGSNCDLYGLSLLSKDKKVFNLGRNINSQEWESQPCFSADGKTMFFASKREGGYGGSDIWISRLNKEGSFGRPINLGSEINTSKDEMAPFIHADTRTLYFSSKGHPGMGGFDLFVSQKKENGQWTPVKNLGYPLNTAADEINMIIAPDGENAYLSAKEDDFDLYHFVMDNNKPAAVSYIKGIVVDSKNATPLFARIELIDLSNEEPFAYAQSYARNGFFTIPLPLNQSFVFNVHKDGYLFYSERFDVNDYAHQSDTLKIKLQAIQLNAKVVLNNILFDIDKFDLLPQSKVELHILINFLANNPTLKIEIGGHTDNVGSPEYNLILSEKRAKSVYNYLLSNGINIEQLSFKGYGESVSIESNETEEGRASNRRTECKIIGLN